MSSCADSVGGDCDDMNATVFPGSASQEAFSGECMMDADGDGYGASTASAYYDVGSDCDDGDARVNPSQSGYFAEPSTGIGTYDYNCDGTLEKQWTDQGDCNSWGSSIGDCTLGTAGWDGSVPGCGQPGSYMVVGIPTLVPHGGGLV